MALRKLVEGDCGGANSLVNLTSHFVQDRALRDEGFGYSHADHIASSNNEQLVQEFLEETMGHSAQPFRMDSLLAEMRDLEGKVGPIRSPPVSQLTREEDVQAWAQQYIDAGKHFDDAGPGIWTTETPEQNIEAARESSQDFLDLGIGPRWAVEFQLNQDVSCDEPTLADLSNSEEYIEANNEIKEVAGEILKLSEKDPKLADSKFMKFMKQINDGATNSQTATPESTSSVTADHWTLEYEQDPDMAWENSYMKDLWTLEGNDIESTSSKDNKEMNEEFNNYLWKKLSKQWDRIENNDSSWTSEFKDFSGNFREYTFSSDNPMLDLSDPLAEGQHKLQEGDLPSAVLCFEAAVSKEPENSLAWQLLGTTQAENEQDPQAITALKKALQLEPGNLTALMSLAVCYTNENFQNQACRALKEWLRMNEKYSALVPPPQSGLPNPLWGLTSLLSRDLHEEVKNMFLDAARKNPTETIDADIQCGLGVLYNLSSETEKAADCFKAALQVRPNDARMWNRLGATLANGSRSEEAVDAYRSALQLTPGFIRARYNLGISCIHLGAHREAAEHLLTALNQQASGRGPQGASSVQMSDSIWNTLRLVISSLLNRSDLTSCLTNRNLDKLNKEFGID